jgi:hypothetical protein
MLLVFFGTDRTAVRNEAQLVIEELGVTPTTIEDASYTPGIISGAVGTSSLFGGTECFLLDTPSSEEAFEEEAKTLLAEMADSQNTFIVLEGPLLADAKKKYTKYAQVVKEYTAEKEERFNVFAIAEAFAKKDKRYMWVLLQQARAVGIRDEETIGILWWQIKSLRLAKVTRSAEEAGMKDYPYKKAKQSLRNFKDGEPEALSRSLLELYHDAHQGKRDMDVALEEWVLKV